MQYLVGIDGGGTSSRLVVVERSGLAVIERSVGLSLQAAALEHKIFMERLAGLLQSIHVPLSAVHSVKLGVAGLFSEQLKNALSSRLAEIGFTGMLYAFADFEIPLTQVSDPATLLICGTGNICVLKSGDRRIKKGGWGYLLESGGGYYLAQQAVIECLRASQLYQSSTSLEASLVQHFKLKGTENIISAIYDGRIPRSHLASFAPFVLAAAASGDRVSNQIIERTVQHMQMCIRAAMRDFGADTDLYLFGGLITDPNSKVLIDSLKHALTTNSYKGQIHTIETLDTALIAAALNCSAEMCFYTYNGRG